MTGSAAPQPGTGRSVSVVIPTFNRRDLLPGAILSALAQTHPVSEVIVIDDGSSDGTVDWLRAAGRDDSRIKLIEQAHGGANRARNAGIAQATGDWIAFLDSDDAWEADKLARQFALLETRPELVAMFSGLRLVGGPVERIFLPRDNPSEFDLRCSNQLSSTSSAVIRTDAIRSIGGFDPALPSCQDWDLWHRLRQCGPFGVVREPLVRFNSGPHERITTNLTKVLDGHRTIFARLRSGAGSDRQVRRIDAAHRLVLADLHRRHGNNGMALRLALRSLLTHPGKWALRSAFSAATGLLRTVLARRAPARSSAAAT